MLLIVKYFFLLVYYNLIVLHWHYLVFSIFSLIVIRHFSRINFICINIDYFKDLPSQIILMQLITYSIVSFKMAMDTFWINIYFFNIRLASIVSSWYWLLHVLFIFKQDFDIDSITFKPLFFSSIFFLGDFKLENFFNSELFSLFKQMELKIFCHRI